MKNDFKEKGATFGNQNGGTNNMMVTTRIGERIINRYQRAC